MAKGKRGKGKQKALTTVAQRQEEAGFNVLVYPERRITSPKLGTKELLLAYSSMPWLRAVVDKVGKGVGTTHWKLYVLRNNRGAAVKSRKMQFAQFDSRLQNKQLMKDDLEEIEDHPLLDLLEMGNPRMLGQSVFQLTQEHLDLVGEGFWLLEKNRMNVPIAVWPIPPLGS